MPWYKDFGVIHLTNPGSRQTFTILDVPTPAAIRRVMFGFNALILAPAAAVEFVDSIYLAAGVQTLLGSSGHTPASPGTTTGILDVDPPTERFVWWEIREVQAVTSTSGPGGLPYVAYHDVWSGWPQDSQGQVAVHAAGDTLSLVAVIEWFNMPTQFEWGRLRWSCNALYEPIT